jgi:lysozyme
MSFPNGTAHSTLTGIDISRYQQKIDWGAVTASGVQFCFIKATEGARDVDVAFERHWESASTAGLVRGAYHFFRPQIPVSAQADLFVRTVGRLHPGDLPPALDLEGTAGWVGIPPASRAPLALKMLEAMERSMGVAPIVYMSPWFATDMLNSAAALARFPIWIAQYTEAQSPKIPKPWNTWTFWQHSQGGKVPGISGFLDLDRFQGSLEDLKRLTLPAEKTIDQGGGNNPKPSSVT